MAGCVYPEFPMLFPYPCASRSEDRELGRRGVVGLDEGLGREDDRGASMSFVFDNLIGVLARDSRPTINNWGLLLLRVGCCQSDVGGLCLGLLISPEGNVSHATTFILAIWR